MKGSNIFSFFILSNYSFSFYNKTLVLNFSDFYIVLDDYYYINGSRNVYS